VRYDELPEPVTAEGSFRLRLRSDGLRAAGIVAELDRPGVVRDALLALGEVLASDLRRKASDRSDYLAYLQSKGKKATQELWNAQRAFLAAKYGEATREEAPLDPVLQVSEDGLALEVFSADESAYARLLLRAGQAYRALELDPGTTHLELGPGLLRLVGRMRSYRATTIEVAPSTAGVERPLRVPLRWVRAFGQVQAASTLPAWRFELAPVDLYNVLLSLRLRKAKKPPRALRYELVPGERPLLVLEPWDLALRGSGPVYAGARPQVVRTWGRQRLMTLARLLPHARRVSVHLVGPGLPAFYVVDLGDAELTLALSGWTDSGWAGISTFDLLVAGAVDELLAQQVLRAVEQGGKTIAELEQATGRSKGEVRQALLHQIQRGLVLHEISSGLFRARPLFAAPCDAERLRFRDEREADAHRLLAVEGQVRITRVHDLGGEGTRIEGEVEDKTAHRTYRSSFTIDREGRTVDATCSSPQFRRAGLREGPTAPMIALRLLFARQQAELERARGTEAGRKLIRAETRTLTRRERGGGSTTYRLSLDDRRVLVRWGHPDRMRMQRLCFADAEAAREEYFRRLGALDATGFIDASAAESA
jgi:hypothetical protein